MPSQTQRAHVRKQMRASARITYQLPESLGLSQKSISLRVGGEGNGTLDAELGGALDAVVTWKQQSTHTPLTCNECRRFCSFMMLFCSLLGLDIQDLWQACKRSLQK